MNQMTGNVGGVILQPPSTAPAPAVTEQAATAAPQPARKFDPTQLEFKVQFELKGNHSTLARALRDLPGWSSSACPSDCSHGYFNDGGNGNFARICSPPLKMASGALDQIAKALTQLQAAGGMTAKSAAMRFYVPMRVLDDGATDRFMKMTAANEDVLYRLGQHGGEGRPIDHKLQYGASITRFTPAQSAPTYSAAQWKGNVSSHGYSTNSSQGTFWELRYFDASFNTEAVKASAQLVCGMVAAAVDGRGTWNEVHAASTAATPVDRLRWDNFMHEAAPPQTHKVLEQNLRSTGIPLSRSLSAEGRQALTQLISRGTVFQDANGVTLGSIDNINQVVVAEKPVRVSAPGTKPFLVPATDLDSYALAETGATSSLSEGTRARLNDVTTLRGMGIEFRDADGEPLSSARVAIEKDDAPLVARRGEQMARLDKGLGLQGLMAMEREGAAQAPAKAQLLAGALPELQASGYTCVDGTQKGPALTWPAAVASCFLRGDLALERAGTRTPVATLESLDRDVLFPDRLKALSEEGRRRYDDAAALADKGYVFQRAGQAAADKATGTFVDLVNNDHTDLQVKMPGATAPTPIARRTLLDTFMNIELKRDDRLDAATRDTLSQIDTLSAKGYKFFNMQTEGEIKTRSGAVLTLQTPNQTLLMHAPQASRKTAVTANGLRNLACLESGQVEQMDPALRAAHAEVSQLMGNVFQFTTADAERPDQMQGATLPQVIATLEAGQPLHMTDPRGNAKPLTGTDALLAEAAQIKQTASLTEEQRSDLQRLQALQAERGIRTLSQHGWAVNNIEVLPWYVTHFNGANAFPNAEANANNTASTPISNWEGLHQFLDLETRSERLSPAATALVDQYRTLSGKGVQFSTVRANRSQTSKAVGMASTFAGKMGNGGVKAHLPHWTFWKGFPRKNITLRSDVDVQHLTKKYTNKDAVPA